MRGCADFIRQDKADAGKGYGAFSMWRSFAWILRTVRSVSETCRGRGRRSPSGIRQCALAGRERSC